MPRQRLVCSDTDPQCTNDSLHHSDTYNSDSDSGSPSHRNIGLTKSCSSSEESSDSPLPTNRTGGQEAFTEESFAGGVEGTEVGYEFLSHPPASSLPRLAYMLMGLDNL